MSKTVDDSGDQPGEEEDKLEVCYGCHGWCECNGSGIVVYSDTLWEYCDCNFYSHTCSKDE